MKRFLIINRFTFIFLIIILIGTLFRFYNINWDSGYHLHPDERALVMFTTPLKWPDTISQILSPESSWNPHFFAYGSFPIYLLKITGEIASHIDPLYKEYISINLVGRLLSTLFDIGTLIFVFLLGKKLFNFKVGLLASFFYAISVLPIQLSHFFAVDTFLTFFIIVTLYQLIKLYENPSIGRALLTGAIFGLSLASKVSALVLLTSIGAALLADFALIFLKNPHRPHIWFPHIPLVLRRLFIDGFLILGATVITYISTEPYAIIDFSNFWKQNLQQAEMTKNAYTFPYTLQYVGKLPFLYEIKNIFLWGQGPLLAILSFIGSLYFTYLAISKEKKERWAQELILVIFFWAYFLTIGRFAIGFMRYLLPVYPLLCLFAAVLFLRIIQSLENIFPTKLLVTCCLLLVTSLLIWPLSFLQVYSKPNTRVVASQWIHQNITPGKTLAVEHWDDRLPLYGSEIYQFVELTLYDQPDDERKWQIINNKLNQTDYIIVASNRLYTPLMKLSDCQKFKACYPKTAEYYKNLFNGSLGFQKVAEFTSSPKVPILNTLINDQNADESFTVYDHPKVIIFKKI